MNELNKKLGNLELLIKKSCNSATCYAELRNEWSKSNPTLGHCAIVSMLVNDLFGGDIAKIKTNRGNHYFNLIDGKILDVTKEQFEKLDIPIDYKEIIMVSRDYLESNPDTMKRYKLLKRRYEVLNRGGILYTGVDNINIDEEIGRIRGYKFPINIELDLKRKDILFLMGILFASGSLINIINLEALNLNVENKPLDKKASFDKMAYEWHSQKKAPKMDWNPIETRTFLICPVRRATEEQKVKINNYLIDNEQNAKTVHYPERDTNQIDSIGYRICLDNANAIVNSQGVHIFYDQKSTGTLFDLGVAYYQQFLNPEREFKVLNEDEIIFNPEDFGDGIVLKMKNMHERYLNDVFSRALSKQD